ncbi:S-layer family protein [Lentilactobacillus otakiensis]|uniref:S-layer family protein n=1 Tax=Lentilactobacillus otakiensis TaxID=481720 RepID=UPI003D17CB67
MNLGVKRSVLLSVAVLGFTVAGGLHNAQSVSAKSYARISTNEKLTIPVNSRNVNFTGSKALYSKVGTLKGARLVAMKSTLRGLASSTNSKNNVRAYRVAVTNRGSVYYKVVTFDGQYRGWIYGGKSTGSFGGGLTKYSTFNNQGMSVLTAAQQSATYKITTPGTTNDGKSVTYKAPSWTQYKVGRAITDSTIYANTNFKIDQVGTRTRENDQWVHIYDPSNASSPAAGWILFSGLTQSQAVDQVADNAVRVNLVDASGKTVKSFDYSRANAQKGTALGISTDGKWSLDPTDQTSLSTKIQGALTGTSYGLDSLSATQVSQLAQATFGSSVNITVNSVATIADNAVRINLVKADNSVIKSLDWTRSGAAKGSSVGSLTADEKKDITTQIGTALDKSGFSLGKDGLSSAQSDAITKGIFGGQVNVVVDPAVVDTSVASVITPMLLSASDAKVDDAQPMSMINADYDNAPVDFGIKLDDKEVSLSSANLQLTTAEERAELAKAFSAKSKRNSVITKINSDLKNNAINKFKFDGLALNEFKGEKATAYQDGTLVGYLINNKLNNLTSPWYAEISFEKVKSTNTLTVKYYHVTFALDQSEIGDGKYGDSVNVYYTASNPQEQPQPTAEN